MHDTVSGAKVTSPGLAQNLESYVRRLLERIGEQQSASAEAGKGAGAPQKLPSAALWTALVLGVLFGVRSLRGVWRSLVWQGYAICDETVYDRLEEEGTAPLQALFAQISQMLEAWLSPLVAQQSWAPLAPFASQVVALDETTLDPVARKLPLLRHFKKGAVELLPGKLAGLFDVRLQLWRRIDYLPNALQNSKVHARAMLEGLAQGTLVLFDLGYFGFEWLDELTLRKLWWVSRLREKTSYTIIHTSYQSEDVFDGIVMLGTGKAQARYAVRLVRWRVGSVWYTYLSNVLKPQVLSLAEIARLYARRWDIELAFLTLKEYLGLHLLWTSKLVTILQQVWACLILAQVLQALRLEIACGAGVDPFEVSLPLVVQALPPMLARGEDVVTLCVQRGRQLGFIRPSSRTRRQVPQVAAQDIQPLPAELVLEREPRYPAAPGQPGRGRSKRQSGPPGLPKELTSAFYACLLS